MERAWIGLGSNVGEREHQLALAIAALGETPGVRVVTTSRVYQTDPVGPAPQGPYLNAAAELEVDVDPRGLLELLLRIEARAGRAREGVARWSARPLDLDLLLYGGRCIDEPDLAIPHPRMHQRSFVLVPLAEIAASVSHPRLGRTVGELAGALDRAGVELHSDAPLEDHRWQLRQ